MQNYLKQEPPEQTYYVLPKMSITTMSAKNIQVNKYGAGFPFPSPPPGRHRGGRGAKGGKGGRGRAPGPGRQPTSTMLSSCTPARCPPHVVSPALEPSPPAAHLELALALADGLHHVEVLARAAGGLRGHGAPPPRAPPGPPPPRAPAPGRGEACGLFAAGAFLLGPPFRPSRP